MGGAHGPSLHIEGDSTIHRLPPAAKLLAHIAFVLVVVATPPLWFWAFAAYAALLGTIAALARVPARSVLRRLVVETPFVVFALLMPFISGGDRMAVLGITVSAPGLLAGWNLLAKATIGLVASILLAATTDVRSLLAGLGALHLPARMVEIASFMVRYLGVVQGEMHRMRVARESRGFEARHLGHAKVVAQSAGALFVRTYERGERVHLAMLSRGGGEGALPTLTSPARQAQVHPMVAAVLPLTALAVLVAGRAWT